MIECKEFVEFLEAYFDHRLPEAVQKDFDEHLAVCPDCVNYLKSYEQTIRLGKHAMNKDAAEPIPQGLMRAILEAQKRS